MAKLPPATFEDLAAALKSSPRALQAKSERFENIRFFFPHGAPFVTMFLVIQTFFRKRGCTQTNMKTSVDEVVLSFLDPMEQQFLVALFLEHGQYVSILVL